MGGVSASLATQSRKVTRRRCYPLLHHATARVTAVKRQPKATDRQRLPPNRTNSHACRGENCRMRTPTSPTPDRSRSSLDSESFAAPSTRVDSDATAMTRRGTPALRSSIVPGIPSYLKKKCRNHSYTSDRTSQLRTQLSKLMAQLGGDAPVHNRALFHSH